MTPLSPHAAKLLSPLTLAYVGDSVHDLFVRSKEAATNRPVGELHKYAVTKVRCGAQADALARIEALLSDEESGIVRRGRNCRARHAAPKGATPQTYARATGLEALLGYLYLSGQEERLNALLCAMDG